MSGDSDLGLIWLMLLFAAVWLVVMSWIANARFEKLEDRVKALEDRQKTVELRLGIGCGGGTWHQ